MIFDKDQNWKDIDFVGFDTETTGQYPLQAELCEIAAFKIRGDTVVDKFQTLIKPTHPMGAKVISIHNITNEMVESAPRVEEVISDFAKFISDSVLVAHHAPFDLGFIAPEFERAKIPLPEIPVLCSSLLARKLFPSAPNHRLQTLVKYFSLDAGQAHRALDDARVCLEVAKRCIQKIDPDANWDQIFAAQNQPLYWKDYSMEHLLERQNTSCLIKAIRMRLSVKLEYMGGSKPGKERTVRPVGIVRNPRGDYLVAYDGEKPQSKKYFLEKIKNVKLSESI